jgi:aminobenzoyl-glutamate utilization protein B
MRRHLMALLSVALVAAPAIAQKEGLPAAVDAQADEAWGMARQIWQWAEVGYKETRSATLLADAFEKAGFKVERGVARIPTAFTATIGEGKPVIGILGEYDALPELSQDAVPYRKVRAEGAAGHACGHHLFATAGYAACRALGEQLKAGKIKGTLRFHGCPAEEGGSAKAFLVRDGLFADCDIALHWHPAADNLAGDRTCLARIAVKFRFRGIPSHAAGSPDRGRSALDAVELTAHASELLREHIPDRSRLHHTITHGGGSAPNVVPEFAEIMFYIRHPSSEILATLYPRLVKCAQAGALATETKLEVAFLGGTLEILPNDILARAAKANLERLCDIAYSPDETNFGLRLQETLAEKPPLERARKVFDVSGGTTMGSTDVGDVSWVVPTTGFSTSCWVPGTPAHSWQAVAAGGTSIGRKGMVLAAKTLAATAWDLFADPNLVASAKSEFARRREGRPYKPLIGKDMAPPLDYRDPPKRSPSPTPDS